MEASGFDIVGCVGLAVTSIFSVWNLIESKRRQRHEDYLSRVTDYRLKFIDLIREPIAEYLESIDRLIRCEKDQISSSFDNYRIKHYQMLSFMTLFSLQDIECTELLNFLYNSIRKDDLLDTDSRNKTNEMLREQLPQIDKALRKLMDDNWFKTKDDIDTVHKKRRKRIEP